MKKQFKFYAHHRNEISGTITRVNSYQHRFCQYEFRFYEDGSLYFGKPNTNIVSEYLTGKYVLYDNNFYRIGPAVVPVITKETL